LGATPLVGVARGRTGGFGVAGTADGADEAACAPAGIGGVNRPG
jgi:hypothetical protein